MTVDPSEPDTFTDDEPRPSGPETPEADAVEQRTDVRPEDDEQLEDADLATANEADVAEQRRVIPLDEDDYR
ncbi:hypothetical protein ABT013_08935 [Streptomyces bacillaris]|uniref:hypothetical protein n=1 Tax=Streptomyces TaxID=1883 RepID=UPI0006AD1091|nr:MULTISPECIES: hypothetical protein [Streptomyces]NUW21053.1 hypothetical protein [Streptomyces roseoviolaceus]ALC27674.1 hypothetical protein ABE83_11640 [Streptomyces sp. CFMR 7]ATY97994.1 hypothetical protein CVT27_22960 [Streptomyces cavourensis]MBT3075765.1 hypothetical protein [Streptomyces sp. COG21]MBT3079721.1 hypothetical protein [Streptomyces sp. COG20]